MLRFSAWIEIWDNFSLSRGDIENQKIWFLEQIANLVFLCQHTLLLTRKRQLATFNIAPITNNLFMPLFRNLHPETSKTKTFEKMTVLVAAISAMPQSIQCEIFVNLRIFAWRLLKCKKLIVANKQVTKLFYFSWMTSSTSLCRAPTIGQPKDLLETHLDHCWGPHWWFDALKSVPVLHFGRFRHAWNWGEIGPFGACRKWPKSNTRTDFSPSNH